MICARASKNCTGMICFDCHYSYEWGPGPNIYLDEGECLVANLNKAKTFSEQCDEYRVGAYKCVVETIVIYELGGDTALVVVSFTYILQWLHKLYISVPSVGGELMTNVWRKTGRIV